jgi:Phosphoinositide phospholipase C, Ca2+-dependent
LPVVRAVRSKAIRAALAVTAVAVLTTGACSGSSARTHAQPTVEPKPVTRAYRLDSTLRLDQIQVLGSHNSYHAEPYPQVLATIDKLNAAIAAGLDYGHRPLAEQFDLGVRQIELDVFADPAGGKFAQPSLPRALGIPPPDPAVMDAPGFKVLHAADVDTHSTCLTFVLCLRAVKTWSDAHPGHVPIMIDVEMKDRVVTPATFDALETEIRSVFAPTDLVTPDDVRGNDRSLGHAVRTRGWPVLGAVRGRIMFMLDNESDAAIELSSHPSLRGRILFAPSMPGDDDAAVAKLNDPIADAAAIKAALAANMLVRTRADADTVQARTDDTTARRAALTGGAQFVSTDYEVPDPRFGPYVVKMPGGTPARCNPVTAPPTCRPGDVEDPRLLDVSTR